MKFLFLIPLLITSLGFAQGNAGIIKLISSSRGRSSVDFYTEGENKADFRFTDSLGRKSDKVYCSVPFNKEFSLTFKIDSSFALKDSLQFYSSKLKEYYSYTRDNNRITVKVKGRAVEEDFLVVAKGELLLSVHLNPLIRKNEKIRIVPLGEWSMNADSIQKELNMLMGPVGKHYSVLIQKPFLLKNFPETRVFRNPSEAKERFTQEMRYIRNAYLKIYPNLRNEHLVFVIPGFKAQQISGFSVEEKTLYFIKIGESKLFANSLFKELVSSEVGKKVDWSKNSRLPFSTWKTMNKADIVFSYFDEYEDIPAATGIVAYYFWKEDALGNISIPNSKTKNALSLIKRPYKRNTFSYHLQLDDFWMKTIFRIASYPFNLIHLLGIIASCFVVVFGGIRLRRWIKNKWRWPRFFRFCSLFLIGGVLILVNLMMYSLVSKAYALYEVKSGQIDEFHDLSLNTVVTKLQSNLHPNRIEEKELSSEIIVSSNHEIELRQRSAVLYFEAVVSKKGYVEKLRCTDARDELTTKKLAKPIKVQNHYFVISYVDDDGTELKEEVYNYLGVNITATLNAKDPARRILVFVNGYRPTSLGSSIEQNFYDIKKNGLEFPNSYNRLYDFDRYQYWQPWNDIDQRFINVFSPTETYYADGHFTVSTSNYRSILNFSSATNSFPKRCKHGKPHHCNYVSTVKSKLFGASRKKSLNLINYRSNKRGFNKRFENGKVAGRNLLAVLNELPNSSKNDTLFIVAHSMGYAYSLGMIEVLRGKINFGSYIIIAPENASAGKVVPEEWQEIWQYGSNLDAKYPDAPCLQDGVAPQVSAKNLPYNKRVFIPEIFYNRKGFSNSHFIGHYTWIFDLKKYQKGYIKRH